jgi:hypothetical protein
MSGTLSQLARAAAANAATPDQRESYQRIYQAALEVEAGAIASPSARESFDRVRRGFQELDERATARSQEVSDGFNRAIEATEATQLAVIVNSDFSLLRGRLPKTILATLDSVAEQLGELRAARAALATKQQELIVERAKVASQIRISTDKFIAEAYGQTVLADDHPALKKLHADKAQLDERIEKINAKMETSHPRFEALDSLHNRLRDYLRYVLTRGPELIPYDGKPSKRPIGDPRSAIVDVRQKVAALAADLHELRSRPRPSSDVKAKIAALVASTATPPNVLGALDHGEAITWPRVGVSGRAVENPGQLSAYAGAVANASIVGGTENALGILCWAFPDQLAKAIEAEVDRYADDANALSDEDRAHGEADLLAKLLLAERDEEALIQIAEERELPIFRRGDADPRAVLGLASSMPSMPDAV